MAIDKSENTTGFMLEDLSQKLEAVFQTLRGYGKLTEKNIADSMKEIRRALLEADVNYKVVKDFVASIQDKAIGQDVLRSVTPGQMIVKIVHSELVNLLGETTTQIKTAGIPPTVIMLSGLQGSGKTTFSAKLARKLKENRRKLLLVAADVYRPAAIEQLELLAGKIDVPVFSLKRKGAIEVVSKSLQYAKDNHLDTVIIDTAGRLHVNQEMMKEIAEIKELAKPSETLFVVDSMTGQDAVNSAKAFNEGVNYNGMVLTKLDGDARGGAALSIRSVVGKPIKFISNGEKLSDLEAFYPERLASRILGKGDIVSLVEKAQETVDEIEVGKLEEKLRKNKFDFDDFLKQIKAIKKMGSLSSIIGMIPGLNQQMKNAQIEDKALIKVEAIINSMTLEERSVPKILNGTRRKRIAKGSGTSVQDVNRLIKQFNEMQKMIGQLSKKGSLFNNLKFN